MTDSTADLEELLHSRFGLDSYRPGQLGVIERLLAGKSAAAVFPTGGGKSLCYQLPALLLEGLTLVVSPLLALMREQVAELEGLGIAAGRLDSSQTADEARQTLTDVRSGKLKLLYVAPERFFNERFRAFIEGISVSLFAIDEAHCISQWGHSFRPDYLKLAKISRELKVGRVLALTATATPSVLDDICEGFTIAPEDAIRTDFYRENLNLRFTLCDFQSRDELLIERLKSAGPQPSLVYVTLQKTATSVAEQINQAGLEAKAYHAGMPDEERKAVQDWFMSSPTAIVVATIAFGMGINKADIRAIYHYNPSKSIENLAQEIGRAGRDGEPAVCETLLVPEDRVVLDNFAHGDTPSIQAVGRFAELLVGQPQEFFVSYYALANESDVRDAVIRSLMTYLELKGSLASTASRYDTYRFKAHVSSSQILSHFKGERREFAASVLALTVKKRIWFQINLAQAASRLKCERSRIVAMLEFFGEKGWIELQASGLVFGYRKLTPITDIDALTQELYEYLVNRESGELRRLSQLFDLMTASECQSSLLSAHFGQDIAIQCGHCSACQGQPIGQLPEPSYPRVGDSALKAVNDLARQHPDQFASTRDKARFLCGLKSPRMSRQRLTQNGMFGCCSEVPFSTIVEFLESRQ